MKKEDFCRSGQQWGVIVDEYGLESYNGHNWYVKFAIDGGVLEEISFHPVEKEMKLPDGRKLSVTDFRKGGIS